MKVDAWLISVQVQVCAGVPERQEMDAWLLELVHRPLEFNQCTLRSLRLLAPGLFAHTSSPTPLPLSSSTSSSPPNQVLFFRACRHLSGCYRPGDRRSFRCRIPISHGRDPPSPSPVITPSWLLSIGLSVPCHNLTTSIRYCVPHRFLPPMTRA